MKSIDFFELKAELMTKAKKAGFTMMGCTGTFNNIKFQMISDVRTKPSFMAWVKLNLPMNEVKSVTAKMSTMSFDVVVNFK